MKAKNGSSSIGGTRVLAPSKRLQIFRTGVGSTYKDSDKKIPVDEKSRSRIRAKIL